MLCPSFSCGCIEFVTIANLQHKSNLFLNNALFSMRLSGFFFFSCFAERVDSLKSLDSWNSFWLATEQSLRRLSGDVQLLPKITRRVAKTTRLCVVRRQVPIQPCKLNKYRKPKSPWNIVVLWFSREALGMNEKT